MGKLKILIVEDDKGTQALYNKGLHADMFETVYATNGKDAMELYHSWHPDIIVLDIMLPIMTGYSVLKKIREEVEDKETTIIMATSLQGKEDIADCSKFGIQGYITKPFTYKEIGNQVIKCYQGE